MELTKEQFVELLETENYNMTLKEKLIENVNIKLTEEQLNEGLLNAPYGLDLIYAKRGDSRITEKTIDAIINKSRDSLSSERVLIQLLKNKNLVFNSEQIDYFLTSDNFRLRVECARNHQLIFSDEQVKYSLENNNFDWEDFADDELYSESDLIEAFLENPNIKLADEIVNTIIFDNSMNHHVESLLNRNDIILNKSQVDRIIAKKDTSTCLMLKKHQLDDNQILKILYTSENWAQILLENYLTRKDIEVSDVIVNVLKISESSDVRKFIENSNDSIKIKKFKA